MPVSQEAWGNVLEGAVELGAIEKAGFQIQGSRHRGQAPGFAGAALIRPRPAPAEGWDPQPLGAKKANSLIPLTSFQEFFQLEPQGLTGSCPGNMV